MSNKYYQESGEINYSNIAIASLPILIGALILGYFYTIINYYSPLIYLNVVCAIGLGIAVLYLVRIVIRFTNIRNKSVKTGLFILAIVSTIIFQWAGYLGSISYDFLVPPLEYIRSILLIFDLSITIPFLVEIYSYGTWSIGLTGDTPVSGLLLLIIWIVEIVLIAWPSIKYIRENPILPYSEQLNQWYPKYTLTNDFESIYSKESIEKRLDTGVLDSLLNLKDGNGIKHSKIHMFFLAGENDQYLSVERVFTEDGGKGKTKKSLILNNYRIDSHTAKQIKDKFETIQERIEVF